MSTYLPLHDFMSLHSSEALHCVTQNATMGIKGRTNEVLRITSGLSLFRTVVSGKSFNGGSRRPGVVLVYELSLILSYLSS
jgi:hypothetical protein